jgi:ankyrin repeat protein
MTTFLDFEEKNLQEKKYEKNQINFQDTSSHLLHKKMENKYELHQACYHNHLFDLKRILLYRHSDINLQDESGQTPLNIAAKLGHLQIVQYLLKKDCLINLCDNDENTPLHNACFMGHYDIVKTLLDYKASTNLENNSGLIPLNYALMVKGEDYYKIVQLLLNQ